MRHRAQFLFVCGLLLVGVAPARAQEPPPPPPETRTYAPIYRFSVGDSLLYRAEMRMKTEIKQRSSDQPARPQPPIPEIDMTMQMTYRMKTTQVRPDGTAVLKMVIEGGEVGLLGGTQSLPASFQGTLEVDRLGRGRLLGITNLPQTEPIRQIFRFHQLPVLGVVLPENPIKIGDSWEVEMPFFAGGQKAKFVNTLLGVDTIDGKEALKIKQVVTAPMEMMMSPEGQPTQDAERAALVLKGQMEATSTSHILEANARLMASTGEVKGTMTMDAAPSPAQGGASFHLTISMNGTFSVDLLKAGKEVPAAKSKPKPAPKKPVKKKRI